MNLLKYLGRTDAWLYFSISFLPGLSGYLLSDQPVNARIITGVFIAALANGLISLKAFRSQSKNKEPVT